MIRGWFAVLTLLGVLLAACGSDGVDVNSESSQPGAAVTAEALDGRSFVSTSVTGHELVAGSAVRLSFDDVRLSGSAGCNSIGMEFAVEDGVLIPGLQAGTTAMGCEPDLMAQDEWLGAFLTSGPHTDLDGDMLTLAAGAVVVTLVDETVADPARPLIGTMWTLDGIIDAQAVSSVPRGVEPPTLQIGDGGQAAVFTGCNRGGATTEIGESSLMFGPMRLTKMACEPEAMALEQTIVSILAEQVEFEIDGSRLTITKNDQGLMYRAP